MAIKFANYAAAALASSITTSTTTITLATGQGTLFPLLAAGDYFYGTLFNAANTLEIVKVTARSGDILTVVRAQEGTTATAYTAGDRFELRPTAAGLTDVSTGVNLTGALVSAALGFTPANRAGDTFSGNITAPYLTVTGATAGLQFYDRATANNFVWYVTGNTARLNSSSAGVDVATIDATGKLILGVGASGASQISLSGYNAAQGAGYHNFLQVTNTFGGATTPTKYFRLNSTGGLEIINNAQNIVLLALDDTGNLTAAGNVTAYSDARLKTNVETIDNALDLVARMRGVYFTKDGKAGVGVIAQEMREVLPQVVHEGDKYLSVAYGNVVGVLIEAVKELTARVQELENK